MSNNLLSPTDHLQRQELLLRMEYEFEKEEFKRQTETMGIARKVKRGLCWYPATPGRSYYNSLNQLVIEITHTEDTDIEHNFEFGRPVCFFRKGYDEKITYFNSIGTISYANETRMVVAMPGAGAILEVQSAENLGVQLYFDKSTGSECAGKSDHRWPHRHHKLRLFLPVSGSSEGENSRSQRKPYPRR